MHLIKNLMCSHHCMLLVAEWVVLLVLHLLMIVIVFGDVSIVTIHVIVIHLLLSLSDHILLHLLSLGHLTCFHVILGDFLTLVILTRLFFLHGL